MLCKLSLLSTPVSQSGSLPLKGGGQEGVSLHRNDWGDRAPSVRSDRTILPGHPAFGIADDGLRIAAAGLCELLHAI